MTRKLALFTFFACSIAPLGPFDRSRAFAAEPESAASVEEDEPAVPATSSATTAADPIVPSAPGPVDEPTPKRRDAAQTVLDGALLPHTLAARVSDARVIASALGGWDGAPGRGASFSGTVEGLLANRIAVRVGYEYLGASGNAYSAGLRVGLLRQERHGFDLAVSGIYRSAGLTEGRGAVEIGVLASRRWSRVGLFANLAYAQGFDLDTRHADARAAVLYAITERFNVGLDGRVRFDIGSVVPAGSAARTPEGAEVDLDLVAGPLASFAIGPVALIAQAGAHVLAFEELPPRAGFLAQAGLGASF